MNHNQAEEKIRKLEEIFPCGHRMTDWDDSYGNCVACQLKALADKADDYLGEKIQLEEKVRKLEEGIRNIPTHEYEDALREGLGVSGAWDCFIEALGEHKKKLLEEK